MAAGIEHARAAGGDIHQQQLVAVVRQRQLIALWRGGDRNRAADIQLAELHWRLACVGAVDLEHILAAGIADDHQALAIVEPGGQPIRARSKSPCCTAAPSQLPSVKTFPRVVTAMALPLGCRLDPSRY